MLKKMKSYYFIKRIFSLLSEKIKLKLVKYNKNLQNIIDIGLINYRYFSGRYIVYEEKNIGKEYDSIHHNLIFEGEYLNGERNGQGKEYDLNGNIIFEGEYLNGKRYKSKQGDKVNNNEENPDLNKEIIKKEFHYNGSLMCEGTYLNGKRWNGKGKEYYYDNTGNKIDHEGRLIFEGEYLYGYRKKENHMLMVDQNMKEIIYFILNIMEKDMIVMVI